MRRSLAILSLALLSAGLIPRLGAAPLRAQSLFGTGGLGLPVAPIDGRARALGGIGTGLFGENPSMVNPADASGTRRRSITAVFQPTTHIMSLEGDATQRGATRFPLIGIQYPLGERFVGSVGYGSFLDASWAIQNDGVEQIGDRQVPVRDVLRSTGGVAQLRVGLAYAASESLALGVAGGVYTGEVKRNLSRTFEDSVTSYTDYDNLSRWRFLGPQASVGIRWDPVSIVRVAGAVTWSGRLDGSAEDPHTSDFSVDLPLQVTGGASALLTPRLQATVGGRWANWSVADGEATGWSKNALDGAVDTWEVGGGLEWQGMRSATRVYPVRLGAHYGHLPFPILGGTPTEWSGSLGLGVRLAPSEVGPGALLDASLERGSRGGVSTTGLTEDFWRFTLSASLFGF